MYCNDWLDTRVVLKYWILFPIFYGNHFQKIRTDLLLRIDTQSTCLFPQYDSWQRKRRLESPLLRAARAFFPSWNNDGKLALFFTLFQIGTTPVCARFLSFAGAKSVFVGPNLTMVSKILVVQPAQIRYIGVEDLSHKPLFWATRNTLALGHKNRAVALLTSNKPAPLEKRTRF